MNEVIVLRGKMSAIEFLQVLIILLETRYMARLTCNVNFYYIQFGSSDIPSNVIDSEENEITTLFTVRIKTKASSFLR